MKIFNFYNFCKILSIILCACFLLSACSSDEKDGNSFVGTADSCEKEEDCYCEYTDDEKGYTYNRCAVQQNSCWQGSLLEMVYTNLGEMTKNVYSQIANDSARNLVLLIFIVWMLFQILRHVASTSPESLGEFWTKIIRKGALCAICAIFVTSPQYVYAALNTFVFPIYITILEFTGDLMTHLDSEANQKAFFVYSQVDLEEAQKICEAYINNFTDSCKITTKVAFTADSFPKEPLNMIRCMACAVNDRLGSGYSIAVRVLVSDLFTGWIAGIFLVIAFTLAKFGFVLYLVDSIFRLDMIILCVPFLIMFYPFEQTRKWTVQGFKIIISSSVIMMCLGVIISSTILAMEYILTDKGAGFSIGDPDSYKNLGIVPMVMIFLGMIILKASSISLEMANAISGYTNNANLQKKLVGLIQTIGKAAFALFTLGAGKIVTKVVNMSERLVAARNKHNKNKQKASASLTSKNG